jgi:hypothetical protein
MGIFFSRDPIFLLVHSAPVHLEKTKTGQGVEETSQALVFADLRVLVHIVHHSG